MNTDWSIEQIARGIRKANELKRIELLLSVVNSAPRFDADTETKAREAITRFVEENSDV